MTTSSLVYNDLHIHYTAACSPNRRLVYSKRLSMVAADNWGASGKTMSHSLFVQLLLQNLLTQWNNMFALQMKKHAAAAAAKTQQNKNKPSQ